MEDANPKDILLADDDADEFVIFELALEQTGIPYILRRADNARAIFALLQERMPAILFLDIHMPCDDGISCLALIRKQKEYDNLPIIMITGSVSRRLISECYCNGANLYMLKKNTLNELAQSLQKVFDMDWEDRRKTHSPDTFVLN